RLAPAKIDKPKIAEILPFSAGSDYSCHPIPFIHYTPSHRHNLSIFQKNRNLYLKIACNIYNDMVYWN
ncbi:hypothetical protein, partial [Ruminococcus sp.]|uniref:hypothetical protein n=1 Tax=Ruminococcus sp. TaxID=41978 RepID=UPI00386F6674